MRQGCVAGKLMLAWSLAEKHVCSVPSLNVALSKEGWMGRGDAHPLLWREVFLDKYQFLPLCS